ncbi:hypothetical protein FBULB1_8635 [Fusarium bulbicola]|nr:hypothetical protein FBULB1_8635 [Fusarium bulbicola]
MNLETLLLLLVPMGVLSQRILGCRMPNGALNPSPNICNAAGGSFRLVKSQCSQAAVPTERKAPLLPSPDLSLGAMTMADMSPVAKFWPPAVKVRLRWREGGTGLTIGAVALVNLFKDCVDLFSVITAARDLGKDAAIIDTMLDVEKMLFLQRPDRVGLLKQDSNNANAVLNNPDTRLIPISSDSKAASSKYDLDHIKDLAELDLVIEVTSNTRLSVSEAAVAAKSALISSRLIRSLWFRWCDARRVNIKNPHVNTLRLLFQILEYDPSVTERALPHMWREAWYSQNSPELDVPFIDEMATALKVLCSTLHAEKKIFLLIDGIDECEEKDLDIARFISDLEFYPNVKILVSSRPHPAFMTAFGQRPKMNLQGLTKRDVTTYIQDTVASNPYMRSFSHQSRFLVDRITHKLVQKASGVFLWVILACRSVVEGCDDFCAITVLEARVDELPKELEDLIEHVLENIDPRCPKHVTLPEMEAQCRVMEGRLRSRCCGLLEAHYGHRDESKIEDSIVKFMHRTLYDMLLQPEISNRLLTYLQRENFNDYTVLSEIWCRMATTPSDSEYAFFNALYPLVSGNSKGYTPAVTLHLLSRLQFIFGQLTLSPWLGAPRYLQHDEKCRRYCNDFSLALTLAIEMGMDNVVQPHIARKFPVYAASKEFQSPI